MIGEVKPESEWRRNVSILRRGSAEGQIRWKGRGREGRHRFLVLLEKRPGKPDHYYRSETILGTIEDACAILRLFQQDFQLRATEPVREGGPARKGRGRRKHPGLMDVGRRARQYWEAQYATLVAEAPPRPPAPAGFPLLKPHIKTRTGRVIDTGAPVWMVDVDFARRSQLGLNIDRLYRPWAIDVEYTRGWASIPRRDAVLSVEVLHAVVLFIARVLEKHAGSTAYQLLMELVQFEAFLAAQLSGAVVGPSELSAKHYRAFAKRSSARGAFTGFYRWCVGQGFPGYHSQELIRIKQIPIAHSVGGRAIRCRDPRKGALTWDEQQLVARALVSPADATYPRDRLIVWLMQELGSRPSAIGSLRNRHLESTPLGDAYILHVPRVKQKSPVNDAVMRKISRPLGDFIQSLREGDDDSYLIPGDLERRWASSACRAFANANDLRSPRLSEQLDDGSEVHDRLPLSSYRLRYTMATNLAEQGASPEQIAAMLDDRTLSMALVYTNNTAELVDILEDTLDRHPTWLRHLNMFLGRVGHVGDRRRVLPVIQGGVPYFANYGMYADLIGEIGWCSNPQACVLRPPLACYRCAWFIAHPDPGVHVQQLDQLKDEVRGKVGTESDRMAKVLRPDMFAVAEVISLTRGGVTATQKIETKIARDGAAKG